MDVVKYTPGPWMPFSNSIGVGVTPVDDGESDICRCDNNWDERGQETHQANARLIAAAPELLEACEGLVANLTEGDFVSETRVEAARAAIAKALGQ